MGAMIAVHARSNAIYQEPAWWHAGTYAGMMPGMNVVRVSRFAPGPMFAPPLILVDAGGGALLDEPVGLELASSSSPATLLVTWVANGAAVQGRRLSVDPVAFYAPWMGMPASATSYFAADPGRSITASALSPIAPLDASGSAYTAYGLGVVMAPAGGATFVRIADGMLTPTMTCNLP
jgi:hypothetical protein